MANNKVVIALFRRPSAGKTTTLKKVIDRLNLEYTVHDVREDKSLLVDRLVIVDINGVNVGISTGGDNESIIKKRLNELLEKKCSIIVTASRSKGKPADAVNLFSKENNFELDWIEKSATYSKKIDKEEYDNRNEKYNQADSEVVLQAIFHYLK